MEWVGGVDKDVSGFYKVYAAGGGSAVAGGGADAWRWKLRSDYHYYCYQDLNGGGRGWSGRMRMGMTVAGGEGLHVLVDGRVHDWCCDCGCGHRCRKDVDWPSHSDAAVRWRFH